MFDGSKPRGLESTAAHACLLTLRAWLGGSWTLCPGVTGRAVSRLGGDVCEATRHQHDPIRETQTMGQHLEKWFNDVLQQK